MVLLCQGRGLIPVQAIHFKSDFVIVGGPF